MKFSRDYEEIVLIRFLRKLGRSCHEKLLFVREFVRARLEVVCVLCEERGVPCCMTQTVDVMLADRNFERFSTQLQHSTNEAEECGLSASFCGEREKMNRSVWLRYELLRN